MFFSKCFNSATLFRNWCEYENMKYGKENLQKESYLCSLTPEIFLGNKFCGEKEIDTECVD